MDYKTKTEMMQIPGPAIVLTDNLFSFFAWAIRKHCHGFYNHSCWLLRAGVVVSQDGTLSKKSLRQYLKGKNRVKIWRIKDLTQEQENLIRVQLEADAKSGRWYDWLGIFGQLLGVRWLNFTGRSYCSEHAVGILKLVKPKSARSLGEQPRPAEMDLHLRNHLNEYEVAGIYDPYEDGIGVETYKKGESKKAPPPVQS